MARERGFEVVTRGSMRAAVPKDRCCACGRRRSRACAEWRGARLEPGMSTQRQFSGARDYTFPLCDDCADARAARDRVFRAGSVTGFAAIAGAGVALFALGGGAAVFVACLAVLLAGGAGRLASRLAGTMNPRVRRGERVARAADYTYDQGRTGDFGGNHDCTFRFTNEKYAHAFARANGGRVFAARAPVRRLARGKATW